MLNVIPAMSRGANKPRFSFNEPNRKRWGAKGSM